MNFVIGAEDRATRLDVFLARVIPTATRSHLKTLNRQGSVRVNGSVVKAGYKLRVGDRVRVQPPPPLSGEPPSEAMVPLDVLYEDVEIAVVVKPAGMVVHPGAGNRGGTLVDALRARFADLSDLGGLERPGIVHRIDKQTSGLMVVARTNEAHHRLSESFRARKVEKAYLAAVHGLLADDTGRIDLSIRRHPRVRTRMTTHKETGRAARSEYRVIERGKGFTLIEVVIHTGRTHQIRVHMSAIGYPVVGDVIYGQKHHQALVRRFGDPGRYFLHAARLGFPHPGTGEYLRFESPLPGPLGDLWDALRTGSPREP